MNTMKLSGGITPRKLIGTLVVAFVLALGVFGSAKAAQAIFVSAGKTSIFDGVIASVGTNSVDVTTNGTNTVTVGVDNKTVITGNQSLSDLTVGEPVKIVAKSKGGGLVAQVINVSSSSGYGTTGDTVLIQKGRLVSKSGNASLGQIVVDENGVDVTLGVNSSTRFFETSFTDLMAGQKIEVHGTDTGSSSTGFVADQVFGK